MPPELRETPHCSGDFKRWTPQARLRVTGLERADQKVECLLSVFCGSRNTGSGAQLESQQHHFFVSVSGVRHSLRVLSDRHRRHRIHCDWVFIPRKRASKLFGKAG